MSDEPDFARRGERRDPARGAALHPGVPRPHGGDQVRRRGDARREPARRLRHRRRPAQVRRAEPGDRPRRRPRDHRATWSDSASRSASTTACGSPTRRRSRWRRWSWSASSTPTSSSGSTATASRRSGSPARTARCSRSTPVANAEQVGFVGTIERVDVDVLNHIAADYIPVIASSASDREGQSYNVNADEAAGKVAAALGAYKAIFLTDVDGWLADPGDEGSLISRGTVEEVEERLASIDGGMRPKLQRLRRRDQRRLPVGPHRRRPPPAQPAAGALHRRRHRHDGDSVTELRRAPGARGALPDADLQAGAGRVRPRRGRRALGRRGQGVPRLPRRDLGLLGRPLPPGRGRGGPRAGRAADARLQPLLHRADGAARRAPLGVEPRRPRLLRQLRDRGERVRDQGRPQARPRPRRRRAGDRQLRGRLPRPQLRRPLGDAGARPQRGAGPDAARLPLGPPRRRRAPCARRSASARRRC